MYKEDELLMLSGIQHFVFCPRQWALIHIEQQWEENKLTVEGEILHNRVDNPFQTRKENDIVTLRSVPLCSYSLGLYGISDVVELHRNDKAENAITHPRYPGYWDLYPIEYKRGHSKVDERDEVQLAAQAICLEEMHQVHIDYGYLFYGETRRREMIKLSDELRQLTISYAQEMHEIYASGKMPIAKPRGHCKSCSLNNLCMPQLQQCKSANQYLTDFLYA